MRHPQVRSLRCSACQEERQLEKHMSWLVLCSEGQGCAMCMQLLTKLRHEENYCKPAPSRQPDSLHPGQEGVCCTYSVAMHRSSQSAGPQGTKYPLQTTASSAPPRLCPWHPEDGSTAPSKKEVVFL